jgi:tetratricopeptide (TPR) repeat protein
MVSKLKGERFRAIPKRKFFAFIPFLFFLTALAIFGFSFSSPRGRSFSTSDNFQKALEELKLGHPDKARQILMFLAPEFPKSAEVKVLYGLSLLDCGEVDLAKELFDQALVLNSESAEVHLGLGEYFHGKRLLREAIDHLQKATDSLYLKLRAYIALSSALAEVSRFSEAKNTLVQALVKVESIPEDAKIMMENKIVTYSSLSQTRVFQMSPSFASTAIDFKNWQGHILLSVKLNGIDAGSFHLDLGDTGSLTISQKLADQLDLKYIGKAAGRGVKESYAAKVALVESIQLGSLIVRNVPTDIIEDAKFVGGSAGNLGKALLQRLNMTIDYSGSKIHLFSQNRPELQTRMIKREDSSEAIPFWCKQLLVIKAKINGGPLLPFILDTGAGACVFHSAFFFENLKPNMKTGNSIQPGKALPYMIESIEVGGRLYPKVFSIVMDLTSLYEKGKMYYPGIIGNNIFQKAKLHFNFTDAVLIIEERK